MDIEKLTKEDIRTQTLDRLHELDRDLRAKMAMLKMDPLGAAKLHKLKPTLKKSLARVLTYKNQLAKNANAKTKK